MLEGKAQYSCKEVNCTEPSPSARIPCGKLIKVVKCFVINLKIYTFSILKAADLNKFVKGKEVNRTNLSPSVRIP